MQVNNLIVGISGAVSASLLVSAITWGLMTQTRLELIEKFVDEGDRFTQEESIVLVDKIERNHDFQLVIETKLDFLIKEIEELKQKVN